MVIKQPLFAPLLLCWKACRHVNHSACPADQLILYIYSPVTYHFLEMKMVSKWHQRGRNGVLDFVARTCVPVLANNWNPPVKWWGARGVATTLVVWLVTVFMTIEGWAQVQASRKGLHCLHFSHFMMPHFWCPFFAPFFVHLCSSQSNGTRRLSVKGKIISGVFEAHN